MTSVNPYKQARTDSAISINSTFDKSPSCMAYKLILICIKMIVALALNRKSRNLPKNTNHESMKAHNMKKDTQISQCILIDRYNIPISYILKNNKTNSSHPLSSFFILFAFSKPYPPKKVYRRLFGAGMLCKLLKMYLLTTRTVI